MKDKPKFWPSLEDKAASFLEQISLRSEKDVDSFVFGIVPSSQIESSSDFLESVIRLISLPNQRIVRASLGLVWSIIKYSSQNTRLRLAKEDLITQLVSRLHPLTPSFDNVADFPSHLISIINPLIWLSTRGIPPQLGISPSDEQQTVHETFLNQVLRPSEGYLQHLCSIRYSLLDGRHSTQFMHLLVTLLKICPSHEPTMNFVLTLPVLLTIPSAMTFVDDDGSTVVFLEFVVNSQKGRDWKVGTMLPQWNICLRCRHVCTL
ncbi:hypothetical protein BLNAU_24028 [Blattamonas nauphoetae]|uniref:Uncharacterized protein n=1 Tax=Blattamonas nauphoetae TaxID=2049346 RepID=A0ABQ9WNJ7_9EUKA|nr:hypothetical protein BLNAU_24028 [Blattamonas nauphoetae]